MEQKKKKLSEYIGKFLSKMHFLRIKKVRFNIGSCAHHPIAFIGGTNSIDKIDLVEDVFMKNKQHEWKINEFDFKSGHMDCCDYRKWTKWTKIDIF